MWTAAAGGGSGLHWILRTSISKFKVPLGGMPQADRRGLSEGHRRRLTREALGTIALIGRYDQLPYLT